MLLVAASWTAAPVAVAVALPSIDVCPVRFDRTQLAKKSRGAFRTREIKSRYATLSASVPFSILPLSVSYVNDNKAGLV